MTKNYFTDEQFKDIANKADLPFEHLPDYYLQKLKDAMNLAVEVAIGDPVGQLSVDYQGFGAYKNITDLPEGYHTLHSVKELDN